MEDKALDFQHILSKNSNKIEDKKSKNSKNDLISYKKKADLIALGSLVGVGALATIVVSVPLALVVSSQNNTEISPPILPPIVPTPPAPNETLINPRDYFFVKFNELEIKKIPIHAITESIIYQNMQIPTNSLISKEQLAIKDLVKNTEMNFVSFSLSSNFNQQFLTKTIYWDVTYSTTDSNGLLDGKLVPAWNSFPIGLPENRWDFLVYPFASANQLSTTNGPPLSYRQNFSFNSLLFYLSNDLRFNSQVYDYAILNAPTGTQEQYNLMSKYRIGLNKNMIVGNRIDEFLMIEQFYTVTTKQEPYNFVSMLPWKIQYYFDQSILLREFYNVGKNFWEITFPIDSIRMVVKEFENVKNENFDRVITPPDYKDWGNSEAITLRTSPSLLKI